MHVKTTIYYFSGTGNSLQAARDLAQRLGGASIQAITKNTEADPSAEAVGIVFPVHLLGVPDMVLQFVEKLGSSNAARYYFAVATYKVKAGEPIGQLRREMARFGIELSAGFTIKMPGNNVIMYNVEPDQLRDAKLEACRVSLGEIAEVISDGEESLPEEASAVGRFFKIGPLRSALVGSFKNSDKRFWTDSGCNGCGTCARVCPAGNITLDDGRPVWQHDCQMCTACINLCPKGAIQSGKGTVKRGRYRNPNVALSELYKSGSGS
jgi:ferredoxin/flavodoxin